MIAFTFRNVDERQHPQPFAYETVDVDTIARLTNTYTNKCMCALISFEGGPIRVRMDGGKPTGDDGHLRGDGSEYFLSREEARQLIAVRETSATSGKLRVTYYE